MSRSRLPEVEAAARIARLRKAIGDGPHAKSFSRRKHLRAVLEMIGDKAALDIVGRKS